MPDELHAAAEHEARAPRGAALPDDAASRDPRPHAPQVRGARRRGGVDRLDELDDRLVDAQENMVVARSLGRSGRRLRAQLRGAVGAARRRAAPAREEPRPVADRRRDVRPWFTPGHGAELSHRIATAIGGRERRVRIASPVITSAPVLATLAELAAEGRIDLAGRDRPHADRRGRSASGRPTALGLEDPAARGAPSAAAGSPASPRTPWGPGTVHDFMHAKVTVADDVVFAGSFNLSRSGEMNAENVLEIHDAGLAERMAAFIDAVRARYPAPYRRAWRRRAAIAVTTSRGSSVTVSRSSVLGRDHALGASSCSRIQSSRPASTRCPRPSPGSARTLPVWMSVSGSKSLVQRAEAAGEDHEPARVAHEHELASEEVVERRAPRST